MNTPEILTPTPLEPFPLFVDSTNSSAGYFAKMGSLAVLSPASTAAKLRQSRAVAVSKLSDYLNLRYYQYEATFGLYVMTFNEKVVLNAILLGIFTAFFYAAYFGLQPFAVRSICQLIYYLTGSLHGVEDICLDASCT